MRAWGVHRPGDRHERTRLRPSFQMPGWDAFPVRSNGRRAGPHVAWGRPSAVHGPPGRVESADVRESVPEPLRSRTSPSGILKGSVAVPSAAASSNSSLQQAWDFQVRRTSGTPLLAQIWPIGWSCGRTAAVTPGPDARRRTAKGMPCAPPRSNPAQVLAALRVACGQTSLPPFPLSERVCPKGAVRGALFPTRIHVRPPGPAKKRSSP